MRPALFGGALAYALAQTADRRAEWQEPVPPKPRRKDHDQEPDGPGRDRDDDEAPETPPTEPAPVPLEEPPNAPGTRGPYVVRI